jgi:hypothetical protein
MSLHYLNPDDEPRECHRCVGEGTPYPSHPEGSQIECSTCHGTGQLGNPDAPKVEIMGWDDYPNTGHHDPVTFGYRFETMEWIGNFPTEAAALAAARKEK